MPATASWLRDKYELENGDLYDAEYNSMIATYYLHDLKYNSDAWTDGNLDYVIAAYNGGTCGWTFSSPRDSMFIIPNKKQ